MAEQHDVTVAGRLAVRASGLHGRGVFALAPIAAGASVERCPVIAFPPDEWEHVERTTFRPYPYDWGPGGRGGALPLGFGALYNHSYEPNARYVRHPDELVLEFVALRAIAAGEEITVNYNGDPGDGTPFPFDG